MSSKLEKLIAYHEAEYAALTAQIDECIGETDYKMAHRIAKGLFVVGEKLRVLHNFQDKFYDDKKEIARRLAIYNEELGKETSNYMRGYWQKEIAEQERKMNAVLGAQQGAAANSTSQVIHQALRKLLGAEIAQFKLVLDKANMLCCNIRLVRKTLIMSIPEIKRHRMYGRFRKKQLAHMQRLGFCLYDQNDKLMLILPYSDRDELEHVKLVLAQLVFEIFYFKEFSGQAYVSYFE